MLSGERHALGSVLAVFLALGTSYPLLLPRARPAADGIGQGCGETQSRVAVGLNLINLPAVQDPVAQLTELSARLPTDAELWLGGPGGLSYCRISYPPAAHRYAHSRSTPSGCKL
jgi:hypothetical protein